MTTVGTTSELLTIAEAAEVLRVSRTSVYRYVTSGELPAHRIGGTLRIRLAELNAALDRPTHEREQP